MEEMSRKFVRSAEVTREEIAPGVYRKIMGWTSRLMVVRVEFGEGTAFPPHNHPHHQITYVVEGEFEIEIEGEKKILKRGDTYVVPGDAMHSVRCLAAGVLLDTFSPMRKDFMK